MSELPAVSPLDPEWTKFRAAHTGRHKLMLNSNTPNLADVFMLILVIMQAEYLPRQVTCGYEYAR